MSKHDSILRSLVRKAIVGVKSPTDEEIDKMLNGMSAPEYSEEKMDRLLKKIKERIREDQK